ncbi:MAG TPA: DNA-processing protein DprA [Terriglobia bacterium]|nr:DNA-processing protein DprA [Terriglobia bacterium]
MGDPIVDFLILASVEGLGCRGAHRLLDHFKSSDAIFGSSVHTLSQLGIQEVVAELLLSEKQRAQAESLLSRCQQNEVRVLTCQDPAYSRLLNEIYDPPLVLFVKGDPGCLNAPAVAIVGSRHATPYGINTAERLARDLAGHGITISSGLARGIDSAAHRGALEAKGKTIAVLGSGLDRIYPRENTKMARQIEQNGCVVSEFPMGTSPSPQNFPIRNRIISGLSLGTCLVEAAEFSGSLITARLALEQNREVFAIPGNITSKTSFGPNLWIKQGAKLVQSWEDIVEELPASIRQQVMNSSKNTGLESQAPLFSTVLTESEKCVLELLCVDEATHIDRLLDQSRMSSSELLGVLLELEIKEKVKQLPGKNFLRKF